MPALFGNAVVGLYKACLIPTCTNTMLYIHYYHYYVPEIFQQEERDEDEKFLVALCKHNRMQSMYFAANITKLLLRINNSL